MSKEHFQSTFPGVYAALLSLIRGQAQKLGYAIGLHGSMRRDLDLIAVPWVDPAAEPAELAEAIRFVVGGYMLRDGQLCGRWDESQQKFVEVAQANPEHKPHGRLAFAIQLGGGAYIDLSIMPRTDVPA